MVIPENLKTLGVGFLLGGVSLFAFRSCGEQSGLLKGALSEIDSARQLIIKAKINIDDARNSIALTRDTLRNLSVLAEQTHKELDKLRNERNELISEFQNTLRKNVAEVKALSNAMANYKKERAELEALTKKNYTQDIPIYHKPN